MEERNIPELRIISNELWDRVDDVKNMKGKNRPLHVQRRPKHLFSGLVHCGECGGGYTVRSIKNLRCSRKHEGGSYTNRRVISTERLMIEIEKGLEGHLLSNEAFARFVQT